MAIENPTLHDIMLVAIQAAKIGGDVLRTHLSRVKYYEVERKMEFDFATKVDHTSERAIIDHILANFPGHQILAEEIGESGSESAYQWIIDPLDGTTNYLHDVRAFSVSIAVFHNNEPVVGVVYDPIREELFTASKNGGAALNGSPIQVSPKHDLSQCLLGTGFPFRCKHMIDLYLESFKRLFTYVRGIRRIGSAALDLCYVASGRFDGFWELDLHKWDIAAGILIVSEAGGRVSGFGENADYWETGNILVSNGHIHDFLSDQLADVFSELESV